MSRRRIGAIAIGVGAATAVVLSLVGAKTQVVIGPADVLRVARGVVAGRKGAGECKVLFCLGQVLREGISYMKNVPVSTSIVDHVLALGARRKDRTKMPLARWNYV